MDFLEGIVTKINSKEKSTAVSVCPSESRTYPEFVKRLPPDAIKVEQGTWQETDGNQYIINSGAANCLSIYAVDRITGHVISGHFPVFLTSEVDNFTRLNIENIAQEFPKDTSNGTSVLIPDKSDVNRLALIREHAGYDQFVLMKKRLQEWITASGANNVEVYLFGNNLKASDAQSIKNTAFIQYKLSQELYQAGIPYTNQHDYRVPGQNNLDDTYYSPKDRVIRHSIRK